MVDKITKAVQKLLDKDKKKIKALLQNIQNGELLNLDIKKLKGRNDVYRVRKGNIRILFHKTEQSIKILAVENRTDTTYN